MSHLGSRRTAARSQRASARAVRSVVEHLESRRYLAYVTPTTDTTGNEAGDGGAFTVGSGCLPVASSQPSLVVSLQWGGADPDPATPGEDYTPGASTVTLTSTGTITIGGVEYYQYGSETVTFTGKQDERPEPYAEFLRLTVDDTSADGMIIDDEPGAAARTGSATRRRCKCVGGDPRWSGHPVRYFDGVPLITGTDLAASGFGADWSVDRSFNTPLASNGTAAGPYGKGWVAAERPYLIDNGGGTIVAVDSADSQGWFDLSGTTYTARFDVLDKLTTAPGEFVLTDTAGDVTRYYNFDASLPVQQRGTFKSRTDAAGNVTGVHNLDASGRPTDIRRSGGGVTESMLYTYAASGPNAGLVESVTLRRSTDAGGTWSAVRSVSYSYYDGTLTGAHAFGRANYLRTATV